MSAVQMQAIYRAMIVALEGTTELLDEAIDQHIYQSGDDRTDDPYVPCVETNRALIKRAKELL